MNKNLILDHASGLPVVDEPVSTQLGTAAWYRGGGRAIRPFKVGDFWLGRSETGELMGLRDDRHVLITSGTRGGKGVSYIIPNLCMWPGSVVVIDPKGENAMVTARRRAQGSEYCDGLGQTVRLLDPFNETRLPFGDHASFNPLDMLDPDNDESIDEAARIAETQVVSEQSNDPFFEESARALIKGLLLHVRTEPTIPPEARNLLTVRKFLMAGDTEGAELAELNGSERTTGFALLFDAMKRNPAFNGVVSRAGQMMAHMEETSPRMFGSVVQVARTNTDYLDSPAMARVLCNSTFKISELKTNPKGTTLYITLPQRYMNTHCRWLRMMTSLVVTEMERVEMQPASGHPVMMLLDEFPALQRMRVIENAAAQIAGFGVKLVFVAQTLVQLKDLYKDNWETMVANAGIKIFFGNDDSFTREYISRSIGDREIVRNVASLSESMGASRSFSEGRTKGSSMSFSHSGNNPSTSMSMGSSVGESQSVTAGTNFSQTRGISQTLHKRALITPDEVGRLFGNAEEMRAIVLVSGYQPMAVSRTPYYRDIALQACFDRHRYHASPPSKVAVRRFKKEYNDRLEVIALEAKRKARIKADWEADYHRQYRVRRRRENWIENRVYEAKLALFALALGGTGYAVWTIWQVVSRHIR